MQSFDDQLRETLRHIDVRQAQRWGVMCRVSDSVGTRESWLMDGERPRAFDAIEKAHAVAEHLNLHPHLSFAHFEYWAAPIGGR